MVEAVSSKSEVHNKTVVQADKLPASNFWFLPDNYLASTVFSLL